MLFRRIPVGDGAAAEICFTDRFDGDFCITNPNDDLDHRRQGVFAGGWTWLHQVHGADIVRVVEAGEFAGAGADGAVTSVVGAVLSVQTADCVPVVLVSAQAVGIVHCGWRGLVAGVVQAGVDSLRSEGAQSVRAVLGPCIRPAGYEFGGDELRLVESVAGPIVRSLTAAGKPALDMAATATALLNRAGVSEVDDLGFDTADDRWWSHRTRGDQGRQITAVRLVHS